MGSKKMSPVSTQRAQARLTISQMLFAVAGVVLGGMFTGIFFVLDKREPEITFWVLVLLSVACMIFSFMAGAWGIEELTSENPHFNRQAVAVLAGFILLGASLFFLGKDKPDQGAEAVGKIQKELGAVTADLRRLDEAVAKVQKDHSEAEREIQKLREDLEDRKLHSGGPKQSSTKRAPL